MTQGIYKLIFPNTDKVYVGQSINIEIRYKKHLSLLKRGAAPSKIQQAFDTYGGPTLSILEVMDSREDMDSRECHYINILGSYEHGFNGCLGGLGVSGLSGISNPCSRYSIEDYFMCLWYLVQVPAYTTYEIEYYTGVDSSVVENISSCKAHTWLKKEFPQEYSILEYLNSLGRNSQYVRSGKYHIVVSPEGQQYPVLNVSAFAKEHSLTQSDLQAVISGKRITTKGWYMKDNPPAIKDLVELINPLGAVVSIPKEQAYIDFAKEYSLTKSGISDLVAGRLKTHRGWRLK